jgi:hypothetical protein
VDSDENEVTYCKNAKIVEKLVVVSMQAISQHYLGDNGKNYITITLPWLPAEVICRVIGFTINEIIKHKCK